MQQFLSRCWIAVCTTFFNIHFDIQRVFLDMTLLTLVVKLLYDQTTMNLKCVF